MESNAVDRDAIVFLPPSYATEKSRRYPVVYALHGYSIGAEQWSKEIHVPQTIEGALAQGGQDMIVVLPDSKTVHNGSMYSSTRRVGAETGSRDRGGSMDSRRRRAPHRFQPIADYGTPTGFRGYGRRGVPQHRQWHSFALRHFRNEHRWNAAAYLAK